MQNRKSILYDRSSFLTILQRLGHDFHRLDFIERNRDRMIWLCSRTDMYGDKLMKFSSVMKSIENPALRRGLAEANRELIDSPTMLTEICHLISENDVPLFVNIQEQFWCGELKADIEAESSESDELPSSVKAAAEITSSREMDEENSSSGKREMEEEAAEQVSSQPVKKVRFSNSSSMFKPANDVQSTAATSDQPRMTRSGKTY